MKTAKDLELLLLIKEHEKQKLQLRINQAIRYIKELCIDDEFYVNLTNKEKRIIDVLNILEGEDDELSN